MTVDSQKRNLVYNRYHGHGIYTQGKAIGEASEKSSEEEIPMSPEDLALKNLSVGQIK